MLTSTKRIKPLNHYYNFPCSAIGQGHSIHNNDLGTLVLQLPRLSEG
jgi:hypothetical protein